MSGLAIFLKSFINLLSKPAFPRKILTSFMLVGVGRPVITSTLARSTFIPAAETLCPRTIPSLTIKYHFSQLRTRFFPSHLANTLHKLLTHDVKSDPYTEKSSIKTSMKSSIISVKIDIIHLWKIAGALQSLKGILRYANVPYRQVNVVFSWSSGWIGIWKTVVLMVCKPF